MRKWTPAFARREATRTRQARYRLVRRRAGTRPLPGLGREGAVPRSLDGPDRLSYPLRMKPTGLAALLLVVSPLAVGCCGGDSCEDVDSLSQQLDDTELDDPDYNDLNERLIRAQADCNAQ